MNYKTVLGVCLVILGFLSCRDEGNHKYESTGVITGQDIRMCPSPCCSGWFINIEGLTYEFDSLPASSGIDLAKETFPMKVELDWQFSNTPDCPIKRITIQRIQAE
ncbi:MAG: hypothetical protein WCE64_13965 [Bacteroidales bacterium]